MYTEWQLLWTRKGRKWLEEWCSKTRFTGDAKIWMERLTQARQETSDDKLEV